MLILPLIDLFNPPLIIPEQKSPETLEEFQQHGIGLFTIGIKAELNSAESAAAYIAETCSHDCHNEFEKELNDRLYKCGNYKKWLAAMPEKTPDILRKHQAGSTVDYVVLNHIIKQIQCYPALNQKLFHGGLWPENLNTFTTNRPLSTTFSPEIAWRIGGHNNIHEKRVDIFVIDVANNANANIFMYNDSGENGHEKEVLFASGVTLKKERVIWENTINTQYNHRFHKVILRVLAVKLF